MKLGKLLKEFWQDESGLFPLIGLAITLAATGLSAVSQVKATRAAQESERASASAEETRRARERLQIVREARIQRAQALQSAENQGVAASSGVQGAVASVGTQAASNQGFVNSLERSGRRQSAAALSFNRAQATGQLANSIGEFGGAIRRYGIQRQDQAALDEAANQSVLVPQ